MKKKLLAILTPILFAILVGVMFFYVSVYKDMTLSAGSIEAAASSADEAETADTAEDETEIETAGLNEEETADDVSAYSGDVVEASLESPATVGDWVKILKYSTGDDAYHEVYLRISAIYKGDEAQTYIDAYNDSLGYDYFSELEDDTLSYVAFTYEIYYPTDYVTSLLGYITAPTAADAFSICDAEGASSVSYEDYTISDFAVEDVSVYSEDLELMPGDTFTYGAVVFEMINDCGEYLIKISSYDGENITYAYYQGE